MHSKIIIETERLILRNLSYDDYDDLILMLKDKEVMYAYEHSFSDEECIKWLNKQINNYSKYGFGLLAVVLKENGKLIGQCGLTMQSISENDDVIEIGYIFNKDYWDNGYATESAIYCKKYAFDVLNSDKVYSIIRDNNISSQRVAIKNGMQNVGEIIKFYYNIYMKHYIYCTYKDS